MIRRKQAPTYTGRTEFRTVTWIRVMVTGIAIGSAAAAVYYFRQEGLTWLTIFYAGFSIVGVAGIIESLTAYVRLEETEIRFRGTLKQSTIPRKDIEKVTWEAGSGVSLRLIDRTWVKVPDLGHNSQGLTNSIRAWLKRS